MYRITKAGNKMYAVECNVSETETQNDIENLLIQGDPVLLVEDLEDAENFGIDPEEIEVLS